METPLRTELYRSLQMSQRGRASVTSEEIDSTDVPVGSSQGTAAVKIANLIIDHPEMRNHITATAAMLIELIRIVGTPVYMLIFVQFLREVDLARAWLGSTMQGHPHNLMNVVPLRKGGSYRSLDFSAVRPVTSDEFLGRSDSFYTSPANLQNSCTEERDDKLFRFLCEVQILLDLLMACTR